VALGADELEAAGARLCGEVSPDPGGRSPVDVDEPERPGRAGLEGFERAPGDAESLPRDDDDGDERLGHSATLTGRSCRELGSFLPIAIWMLIAGLSSGSRQYRRQSGGGTAVGRP